MAVHESKEWTTDGTETTDQTLRSDRHSYFQNIRVIREIRGYIMRPNTFHAKIFLFRPHSIWKLRVANERTYPCLPCRDLDEAIEFYNALGFSRTYRQLRPNPYAVVVRDELQIHLFGMPEFDPAQSYGSVIVVVPDPDALYHSFAEGLRKAYQKLPVSGIPRILRPRKKFGTVRGFSVVDVGGNWLRVSKTADEEGEEAPTEAAGLAKIILVAARLGDAHGDDAKALKTLETGLLRHPDAPPGDRARALLYRAELACRVGNRTLAEASLAEVLSLKMGDDVRASIAEELAQTIELVSGNDNQGGT